MNSIQAIDRRVQHNLFSSVYLCENKTKTVKTIMIIDLSINRHSIAQVIELILFVFQRTTGLNRVSQSPACWLSSVTVSTTGLAVACVT